MRKLILALGITVLTLLVNVSSAHANCLPSSGGSCLVGLSCSDGLTCCTAISECPGPIPSDEPLCGVGDLGVNTAIGCLMAGSPTLLITDLLSWGAGLGIGIAMLLIIFAGFQITTAAGDPKRVKAGQELITSAISGLILIIFSIVLLNFIGVQLLNLPGFVGNPFI